MPSLDQHRLSAKVAEPARLSLLGALINRHHFTQKRGRLGQIGRDERHPRKQLQPHRLTAFGIE